MDIKQISKTLRYAFGATVVALSVGGAAFANSSVDVTDSNHLTGPSSINTNKTTVNHDTTVHVSNTANADTNVSVAVDSGGNVVMNDTSVGDFNGGSVSVSGTFDNTLNSGASAMIGDTGDHSVSADFSNNTTGPNSRNTNTLQVNDNSNTTVTNRATIDNSIRANLSSGDNHFSNLTTLGDVHTGDVNFNVSSTNTANSGASDMTGLMNSSSSVNVTGGNSITGPNSSNDNTVKVNNNTTTNVTNTGTVDNNISVTTNTGGNTVTNSTTVGNVSTGDTTVDLNLNNSIN